MNDCLFRPGFCYKIFTRLDTHRHQRVSANPALMRLGRQNTLSYFFLIKCTFLRQYSIDKILYCSLELCLNFLAVCRQADNKLLLQYVKHPRLKTWANRNLNSPATPNPMPNLQTGRHNMTVSAFVQPRHRIPLYKFC